MCGICGIVGPAWPGNAAELRPMASVLRHRGPDEQGEQVLLSGDGQPAGWFGHRRLKVIDLGESARQPMSTDGGRIVLSYNGEVYNYRELRRRLERLGHGFSSSGDTEVVLRAYREWGIECVSHLDGMFAFAVWDAGEDRLVLARDRVGKKPLYYARLDGGWAFGSEIKSLLACPYVETALDEERLAELLVYGYPPWPATLHRSVEQVPPGTSVILSPRGEKRTVTYWTPPRQAASAREDRAAPGRLAELLEEATRRRMVADVPLGALLSGGIDSSIVVGLMARHSSEPIHTFSVGFPEDASYDERPAARRVAEHFGCDHKEFSVRVDAVALLDRLIWHHDQPFADSSAIPTFLVSQLAREHVTVVLNGDGGDEVFGGYDRFKAARLARRLPPGLVAVARGATTALPRNSGYFSLRRRAERFLELAGAPVEDRYQSWISVFAPEKLGELLGDRAPRAELVTASMRRQYEEVAHLPELDRILYANLRTYLPDDLAVKMDRMSMANSLEARSPLLDTRVIEAAAAFSAADKVGIRTLKPVLRASMGDLLPRWVWERRKHGFGVPMGTWLRGPLGEVVEDELLSRSSRAASLLDLEHVRQLYAEHRRGEAEHGVRLWTLLTLERWLRSLERGPQLRPPSAGPIADAAVLTAR